MSLKCLQKSQQLPLEHLWGNSGGLKLNRTICESSQKSPSTVGCESPRSWVKEGSDVESEGLHQWIDTDRLAMDIREAWGGVPPIRNPTTSRSCSVILVRPPIRNPTIRNPIRNPSSNP